MPVQEKQTQAGERHAWRNRGRRIHDETKAVYVCLSSALACGQRDQHIFESYRRVSQSLSRYNIDEAVALPYFMFEQEGSQVL